LLTVVSSVRRHFKATAAEEQALGVKGAIGELDSQRQDASTTNPVSAHVARPKSKRYELGVMSRRAGFL
jgi:hypothetical protein